MVKSNPQDGLERNGQVNNYKGDLRMILQKMKQSLKDKFRAYKIKRLNSRKRVAPGAYKLANVFGQSIDQIIVKMFSESKTHNKKKILALGGISPKNIRKLKLLYTEGFGGISIFKKKTGLKEAGFHKE